MGPFRCVSKQSGLADEGCAEDADEPGAGASLGEEGLKER